MVINLILIDFVFRSTSISIRNWDPLRDEKINFQVYEVLVFQHTDFLKLGNVPLYQGDIATEIMRPLFTDFKSINLNYKTWWF